MKIQTKSMPAIDPAPTTASATAFAAAAATAAAPSSVAARTNTSELIDTLTARYGRMFQQWLEASYVHDDNTEYLADSIQAIERVLKNLLAIRLMEVSAARQALAEKRFARLEAQDAKASSRASEPKANRRQSASSSPAGPAPAAEARDHPGDPAPPTNPSAAQPKPAVRSKHKSQPPAAAASPGPAIASTAPAPAPKAAAPFPAEFPTGYDDRW